jgi:hypothetical protein
LTTKLSLGVGATACVAFVISALDRDGWGMASMATLMLSAVLLLVSDRQRRPR